MDEDTDGRENGRGHIGPFHVFSASDIGRTILILTASVSLQVARTLLLCGSHLLRFLFHLNLTTVSILSKHLSQFETPPKKNNNLIHFNLKS